MIEFDHEKQRRLIFAKFSKYAYLNPDEARTAAKVEGFPFTEVVDIDGAQVYVFYNNIDVVHQIPNPRIERRKLQESKN